MEGPQLPGLEDTKPLQVEDPVLNPDLLREVRKLMLTLHSPCSSLLPFSIPFPPLLFLPPSKSIINIPLPPPIPPFPLQGDHIQWGEHAAAHRLRMHM